MLPGALTTSHIGLMGQILSEMVCSYTQDKKWMGAGVGEEQTNIWSTWGSRGPREIEEEVGSLETPYCTYIVDGT